MAGKTPKNKHFLLYNAPVAAIREEGKVSQSFNLHRGMRQGCPLSPLPFAVANEPLAALICSNTLTQGFHYGNLHEKLIMYADDTMLFLGDNLYIFAGGYGSYIEVWKVLRSGYKLD